MPIAPSVLAAYAFNRGRIVQLVADIPDEQLTARVTPQSNPPLWILGHLAALEDAAGRLLGLAPAVPDRWWALFGPRSNPSDVLALPPAERPSRQELMAALHTLHERLTAALLQAGPEALARPHGVAMLEGTPLKTVADAFTHLLTSHTCFHAAQLAGARRSLGFEPML
jgi:hypothetical protein